MSFINKAKFLLLIVFIGWIAGSSTQNPIEDPLKDANKSQPFALIDFMRKYYLKLEENLWELFDSGIDIAYVLEQMHIVHLKFFGERFGERNVSFNDCSVEYEFRLKVAIDEINRTVSIAVNNYMHENPLAFNERESIAMARRQLNLTQQMDELFAISGSNDFYQTINNKAQLKQCDQNIQIIKSANQLIYEYYHDISAAELKAYALVQLAYMFYSIYNRGDYRNAAQALRAKYLDRTHQTQQIVKHLLETSNRNIWRCDPNHFSVGTYEEITNFLQGYVDNEVNLNPEGTCQNTCNDYRVTENYGCFEGTYCDQKPVGPERDRIVCKGKIVDCEFIGSDLNVCSSPNQFSRRYDVLHYDNGNILGRNGAEKFERCQNDSDRILSWTRWVVRCTNCFCLCDDQKHSERHFSLRDVLSDVHQNKVVSGVALKKFQGVFHLMITERELQPYATLNSSAPSWHTFNAIDYFNIHDGSVREGIDYHTLTWENRSINLDTVEIPAGKVVTGLRFRIINGTISLQARATDFDFIAGRLKNVGSSVWYTSPKKERTEIIMEAPDVPTLTPDKSIPHIERDRFIKFGPSDKFKDLSQTTVPYIDSQLVESHNLMALSGVGLYYKSFPGYGGFIAPKILNYNMGPHIGGSN